jgi:predicted ATPase/transcriptional regulator with XRE-family HTH domain
VTTDPSPFGTLLKRFRVEAGLTQEELAERARLSTRAISDLERGARRSPYRDTVHQLADALGLDGEARTALTSAARRVEASSSLSAPGPPASSSPANLPLEPTSFIGRRREIAAVLPLLLDPAVRLLTLTGPGGIGKTRLAVHLAANLLDAHAPGEAGLFHDGIRFVSLAPLADPGLVVPAIAGALGVEERAGQGLVPALIEHLRSVRLLLVLDNFEHVLEARSLLAKLLEACSGLRLLVTSRTVLNLSWERAFEVPPLGLPELLARPAQESPNRSEALALFVERARAVRADFSLTDQNAGVVVQICRSLDGMPLAIELAAARLRLFPPHALLQRLSQRLQFLTGGAHDLPARHQTLRAAIDWSYALLSEEEQQLFARLSVFRGGCALDAAEAVCSPQRGPGSEILDGVTSLVEKSLLRQDGDREPRFVMLETIREYAAERLKEAGPAERVRDAHAVHYLSLTEEAAVPLEGQEQRKQLDRLEVERDNLRAALEWLCTRGDADRALRLALALQRFWTVRGPLSEGQRWLSELGTSREGSDELRAAALSAAGALSYAEGRLRESTELVERSLSLYRQLGDSRHVAASIGWLVNNWHWSGEVERADALLRQSEIEARETGDQWLLAMSLSFQATLASEHRDIHRAQQLGEESLAIYEQLNESESALAVMRVLVDAAYTAGDTDRARALTDDLVRLVGREPLDSAREDWLEPLGYRVRVLGDYASSTRIFAVLAERAETVGDRRMAAHARTGLGLLAREQGDFCRSAELYEEAMTALQDVGDLLGYCRALVGRSDVARDQGDAKQVIELCERAREILPETGDVFLTAFALYNLGWAAWYQGDRDRTRSLFDESAGMFLRQESVVDSVEIRTGIGLLALDEDRYEQAGAILSECLTTARAIEGRWLMPVLLEGMAGVAAGTAHPERSALLFGAASAARESLGTPQWPARLHSYGRHIAAATAALGPDHYAQHLNRGRKMTLDQAVSLALDEP